MDYYIVVNGQKQGPYDLLGFIKKVKNHVVTPDTLVATNEAGPFIPASQLDEIKEVLIAHHNIKPPSIQKEGSIKLSRVIADGFDLWMRRVLEYTLLMGAIIVIGIFSLIGFKKIQLLADYSFLAEYLSGVITITLIGLFFYYVLITKRNQEPEFSEIGGIAKGAFPTLLIFAALMSLSLIIYSINLFFSIVVVALMLLVVSFLIFVPFLVVDHKMGLGRAIFVSLESFRSMSLSNMAIVFLLVTINIIAALLPVVLASNLGFLALLISLPITVSALAYIYDQVLA